MFIYFLFIAILVIINILGKFYIFYKRLEEELLLIKEEIQSLKEIVKQNNDVV